jgi:hypothetical protein
MKEAHRVVGSIPILNKDYKQEGWFTAATSIPYQLESPAEMREGIAHTNRHYLAIIDGKLFYLHEEAPLYALDSAAIPILG